MKAYPPGTRLGQFEIISYPSVSDVTLDYICLDHAGASPVLIKALQSEFLANQAVRETFIQCGTTWMELGAHPHIVHCRAVWKPAESDEAYLILSAPLSEKDRDTPSLLAWLTPGQPLQVLQALLFALQIARGMKYATDKIPGFVHGDLKPENILINGGRLSRADVNRVRVTNIGLAAVLKGAEINLPEIKETSIGRTQNIHGVVGTPQYMSPEQWRGETASMASDVYALGCLLYKMLAGREPVAGETIQAMRNAHTTGNIRPLPVSLPEGVRALITRCLALASGQRYQSWEAVEIALASAYEDMIHYPVPAPEQADTPTPSEHKREGWLLNAMGCNSTETGNVDTAVKCLELALEVAQAEDDRALVGVATNNLGAAYRMQGNTQLSIESHQKALKIADEINDRSMEGTALNGLGVDQLQLGNPRQAVQHLEKALALARAIHDSRGEMAGLGNLGNLYQQLGDLRRATQYFEQVLELARKRGDRRGESIALTDLGGIYSSLGDDRRAIQYLEQSLKVKSEIGERQSQGATLNNLANAYRNLGNARPAFDNYNKALELALEMGDRRGEAFALNNIGATHSNLGNMDAALKYHEQALAIFKEIGDKRSQGDCLTNLGFIYMTRGDTDHAQQYCEAAIAIDREVGDLFGLALDSFNMANLLAQNNRLREALAHAEEAAGILENIGHPTKAPEARRLADLLRAQVDHGATEITEAMTVKPATMSEEIRRFRQDNPTIAAKMSDQDIVEAYKQAERASANDRPTAFVVSPPKSVQEAQSNAAGQNFEKRSMDELIVLGQQLAAAGQWQAAEQAFQTLQKKANQANRIPYQALALVFQGRLQSDRGDQLGALRLFNQASSLAKQTNDLQLLSQIYDGMGSACKRQGDYEGAIKHHQYAIDICERNGDDEGVILSRANLGNVYLAKGNFDQAVKAFKDLLTLAIRQGADQICAQVYGQLGSAYRLQGLRELALEMDTKSLNVALRIGDQATAANAYGNLGAVRADMGDYPTAIQMIRKAVQIMEQLGNDPASAQKYADLASLYSKIKDDTEAFLCYDRALFYYDRVGDRDSLAKIHFNMGNLYRQQGKTAQAREEFKQAQAIFESIGEMENAERATHQWR